MLCPILYYNAAGWVIGTLDVLVATDGDGRVTGLVDFSVHEAEGGRLRDFAEMYLEAGGVRTYAAGAGTWPEWLDGGQLAAFRVELDPRPAPARARISALVHSASGLRRERTAVEAAITAVEPDAGGAKDLRRLVGGPDRPLHLDDRGWGGYMDVKPVAEAQNA